MFAELLAGIAEQLQQEGIDYMVIGGQAVLLYGEPRLTKDIDITLAVDVDYLPQVRRSMSTLGVTIEVKSPELFVRKTRVLPMVSKRSGIRVDFIFSNSPYERNAIRRARKVRINRRIVYYASAEDVIIHKIFAGRPRDIEDVSSIISKQPKLDTRYIRLWLKKFQKGMDIQYLSTFNKLFSKSRKTPRKEEMRAHNGKS